MLRIQKICICLGLLFIAGNSYNQIKIGDLPNLNSNLLNSRGESLEDFFTSAIINSPQLQIAAEQLKIGTARRNIANSVLLPQVRGNANVSDNTRDSLNQREKFDGNRYSVQLTQVLFNWAAFTARTRAYLREDIAEIEYYNQLASLLTDIAEKYFDVLQSRDALDSISSELEAVENQLAQIERLYELQLAQITDLYQTQASVFSIQAQKTQLESQLALANEALSSASGINIGNLYILENEVVIPALDSELQYWVDQALSKNYELRAGNIAVQEAQKSISERRGAYMPQISLIVQRQDSDVGFDNRPIIRSDITYFGLDITVPLYSGGGNSAQVREARSQKNITKSRLEQTKIEVLNKVRSAFLAGQAGASIVLAAEKLFESTSLNADAMQQGFNLGAVTSVDLLNAVRDKFQSERDLQRARYEQIKTFLTLKKESGLLTTLDLDEVNSWLSPSAAN